jgi:hypothetical protein
MDLGTITLDDPFVIAVLKRVEVVVEATSIAVVVAEGVCYSFVMTTSGTARAATTAATAAAT